MSVFDPVELSHATVRERALEAVDDPLEAVEARLDAAPARGDELDENGEILHASPSLGVEVALKALEPADRLAREASHLGDVAPDGKRLGAHRGLNGRADPLGNGGLELGRPLGELFERGAGGLEGGGERGGVRLAPAGLGEAPSRPLERFALHEATVAFAPDGPTR